MTYKEKTSKDRDYSFNDWKRKNVRNTLFRELSEVFRKYHEKYPAMTKNDVLHVLAILRHKILEVEK